MPINSCRAAPCPPRYSGWVSLPTTHTLLAAYVPVTLAHSMWAQQLPRAELWPPPPPRGEDGGDGLALAPPLAARVQYDPKTGYWSYARPDVTHSLQIAQRVTDGHWSLACYRSPPSPPLPAWYVALGLRLNVLYELETQLTNLLYMQTSEQERLQREESDALKSEDPHRVAAAIGSTSDLAAALADLGPQTQPLSTSPTATGRSGADGKSPGNRVRVGLSAGASAESMAAGGSVVDAMRTTERPPSDSAKAAEAHGVRKTTLKRAPAATRAYDTAILTDTRARHEGVLEGKRMGRLERAQAQARITYTLRLVQRLLASYTEPAAALFRATESGTVARSQAELEADPAVRAAFAGWRAPYVYHPRDAAHARWILWPQAPAVPSALAVLLDGCGAARHGLHEGFDWLIRAFQHLDQHPRLAAWHRQLVDTQWGVEPVLPDLGVADAQALPDPVRHAVFWATVRSVWALERLRPEACGSAVVCNVTAAPAQDPSAGGWWPDWVTPEHVGAALQRRLTAFLPLAQYFAAHPLAAWDDRTVPYAVLRPAAALEWVAGTARWNETFGPHVRDLNFHYQREKQTNSVLFMLEKVLPFRAIVRSLEPMVVERARTDREFARVVRDLAQAEFLGLEPELPALPLATTPQEALAAEQALWADPLRWRVRAGPRPRFAAMVRLYREVFAPLRRDEQPAWAAQLAATHAHEQGRHRSGKRKRAPKATPKVNPVHERLFHFVVDALPREAKRKPDSKLWTNVTRAFLCRLVHDQPHVRQALTYAWDALETRTSSIVRTLRRTLDAQLGRAPSLHTLAVHQEVARAVKEYEKLTKFKITPMPKQSFVERLHSLLSTCLVERRRRAMLLRDYIEQVRDLIDPAPGAVAADLHDPAVLRAALPETELLTALLDHAWPPPPPPRTPPPPGFRGTPTAEAGWALWLAQGQSMAGATQPLWAYQQTLREIDKRNAVLAKDLRRLNNSLSKPRIPSREVGERWQQERRDAEAEQAANVARRTQLTATTRAYLGARMGREAPLGEAAVPDLMRLAATDLLPHVPVGRLPGTLARYAETLRRTLPALEYEIPAEEKTWIWRLMSGMDQAATPEARAQQRTAFAQWLIPPLSEHPTDDPSDDGGAAALFAQLCERHARSASNNKMLEVAEQLPTLPQTHLAFAAQVRRQLDAVQLVPLPEPVSLRQVRAMRSQRYALMPGEHMPPRVWHVYVTFCCNRVATYAYQSGIGHKHILYDVQRGRMTCGIRKRRAEAATSEATQPSRHRHRRPADVDDDDEDEEEDDDEEEEEDDDDATVAALLQGAVGGEYAYPLESETESVTDEESPTAAHGTRPRGWRPPTTAKYQRFSAMPEKTQAKAARTAHLAAQRIDCGAGPPVMCLNLWGYRLVHGSGVSKLRAYQHCPRCGRFHRCTEATASYGGYVCDHCRRERAPPLIVERRCARCCKPVPNVPEVHARPVVFLDDPARPVRTLWWCTAHRPWISERSTQGLFADTHDIRLTKRSYRSKGLQYGPVSREQRQYQQRKMRQDRERYSARGQRHTQWQ